jgi:hypothetical protein
MKDPAGTAMFTIATKRHLLGALFAGFGGEALGT